MRKKLLTAIGFGCLLLTGGLTPPASAQVAQWNQTIVDRELREAFYTALREVSVNFITAVDEAGHAGAIVFVDHQLDYPLQLTTANFRHVTLNAAQAKIFYILEYQAKTSAGTLIPIGGRFEGAAPGRALTGRGFQAGYGGAGAEIAGDGGMMLCPINRAGLEFMLGALAVATLGDNGEFRAEQDGAAIIELHDAILARTYELYGTAPE